MAQLWRHSGSYLRMAGKFKITKDKARKVRFRVDPLRTGCGPGEGAPVFQRAAGVLVPGDRRSPPARSTPRRHMDFRPEPVDRHTAALDHRLGEMRDRRGFGAVAGVAAAGRVGRSAPECRGVGGGARPLEPRKGAPTSFALGPVQVENVGHGSRALCAASDPVPANAVRIPPRPTAASSGAARFPRRRTGSRRFASTSRR